MLLLEQKVKDTIKYINDRVGINIEEQPKVGIILGSGLEIPIDKMEDAIIIPYKDLPHFPLPTVVGHKGQMCFGRMFNKSIICMQGRFHYYEGYSVYETTYPVRVMQRLGVSVLIVTNSSGGVNIEFNPGDLMLIKDHINLMGINPLIGKNVEKFGPRFPDMSQPYSEKLGQKAKGIAQKMGIDLKEGVYAALTGPSYETPAEIRFLRAIGADAVGMSTVPEVIVANHGGIDVLGISCITNAGSGVKKKTLSHDEVLRVANTAISKFIKLICQIIETL